MTVEEAAELGWVVKEDTDGSWGHRATRSCWRIRHRTWSEAVWHAKAFDTETAALAEVESRVAGKLRVTVPELREHLDRVRRSGEVA